MHTVLHPLPCHRNGEAGFSLVEVLVTIVVLSIGMLGSAGMQTAALQANTQTRHQVVATSLASELAEAMRGNHLIALNTDPAATRANWRRVRAVRIGLVVRGPVGSAVDPSAKTLWPLGSTWADANDVGSVLQAPADGRLRTAHTFTVHLRNDFAMP